MANHVLWADDDSDYVLGSLQWLLENEGVPSPQRFRDYSTAAQALSNGHSDGNRFGAVLLDIILPYARQQRNFDAYLGLTLAQHALTAGVKRVAFLTVVPKIEIADRFRELQQSYPDVEFGYFGKLTLLEGTTIADLAHLLMGSPRQ
jgi:hypothetical protein